jgi:hypothetical protein
MLLPLSAFGEREVIAGSAQAEIAPQARVIAMSPSRGATRA